MLKTHIHHMFLFKLLRSPYLFISKQNSTSHFDQTSFEIYWDAQSGEAEKKLFL